MISMTLFGLLMLFIAIIDAAMIGHMNGRGEKPGVFLYASCLSCGAAVGALIVEFVH